MLVVRFDTDQPAGRPVREQREEHAVWPGAAQRTKALASRRASTRDPLRPPEGHSQAAKTTPGTTIARDSGESSPHAVTLQEGYASLAQAHQCDGGGQHNPLGQHSTIEPCPECQESLILRHYDSKITSNRTTDEIFGDHFFVTKNQRIFTFSKILCSMNMKPHLCKPKNRPGRKPITSLWLH